MFLTCSAGSSFLPMGSLVCGDRAFIDEVYRMRKRLGGAMRQAGVVAAAGIVAYRLSQDAAQAQLPIVERLRDAQADAAAAIDSGAAAAKLHAWAEATAALAP